MLPGLAPPDAPDGIADVCSASRAFSKLIRPVVSEVAACKADHSAAVANPTLAAELAPP
jgi:hypothetical protein